MICRTEIGADDVAGTPGEIRRWVREHLFVPTDIQRAAGGFVEDFAPWTHYATLLFEDYVPRGRACGAFRRWISNVARRHAQAHVRFAYCIEAHRSGVWHLHALLALPRPVPIEHLHGEWLLADQLSGFTHIRRYLPSGGAPGYLTKGPEWDVNIACDRARRCRRKGCVVAGIPLDIT